MLETLCKHMLFLTCLKFVLIFVLAAVLLLLRCSCRWWATISRDSWSSTTSLNSLNRAAGCLNHWDVPQRYQHVLLISLRSFFFVRDWHSCSSLWILDSSYGWCSSAWSHRSMRSWRSAGTTTPACVRPSKSSPCAWTCSGTVRSFKPHPKCPAPLQPRGQRDKRPKPAPPRAECQSSLWLEEWWFKTRTSSKTSAKVPLCKALNSV